MMTFVRIDLNGDEWGFHLDAGLIPLVGDFVMLRHAMPDTAAGDYIEAVIVKRMLSLLEGDDDFFLIAESEQLLPTGHIADSQEWPSVDASERAKENKDFIERSFGKSEGDANC